MNSNATYCNTARTGNISSLSTAANDQRVVPVSSGASLRRTHHHWSSLCTLKSPHHRDKTAGILSRAGVPLLATYIANTGFSRLKGLFAFPPLTATQALVIHPCSAVHTFGFKHAIDVVFVDKQGVILKCQEMNPGSICLCRGSRSVLEMANGALQRLKLQRGQQLDIRLTGYADE